MSEARCCGDASAVGGYFFVTSPCDLRRLAASSERIHQVELGFEVRDGEPRDRLERRLQRLHAECGCDAAAIAFLSAVAAVALGIFPLRLPVAFAAAVGIAVVAKLAFIAIARLRILLIARRLSSAWSDAAADR